MVVPSLPSYNHSLPGNSELIIQGEKRAFFKQDADGYPQKSQILTTVVPPPVPPGQCHGYFSKRKCTHPATEEPRVLGLHILKFGSFLQIQKQAIEKGGKLKYSTGRGHHTHCFERSLLACISHLEVASRLQSSQYQRHPRGIPPCEGRMRLPSVLRFSDLISACLHLPQPKRPACCSSTRQALSCSGPFTLSVSWNSFLPNILGP